MVVRTARTEPGRVFLPAVVIFGLDAASSTFFSEISVDNLGAESVAFAALLVSTLGLTFYAGLLERLVGAVERNHPAPPLGQVIRTLPYVRLLAADLILWVISGLASLAFIIPGLIVTTLFALIGPLINMEDLSIRGRLPPLGHPGGAAVPPGPRVWSPGPSDWSTSWSRASCCSYRTSTSGWSS